MNSPTPVVSRRHALKQTFFFSAAIALGSRAPFAQADEAAPGDRHFLMIGDYGTADQAQKAVAKGMQDYARAMKMTPDGLFLVGDNFYGAFPEGLDSPRWKTGFEDMYPATAFPGPCWVVLGNHDYDNEPVIKIAAELAYNQARPGTRWTMPAKWYRVEWPAVNPVVTCLMLDSNYKNSTAWLKPEERAAQLAWLTAELAKPRTTPWLVAMGHHPLYSNGHHGDTKALVDEWGPLFQKHGVDFYFCGHDHDLQHLEFEGRRTSFVLSGGGGAGLHDVSTQRGPFAQKVHGFTHLQVSKEKFVVRHVDGDQKQLHAFGKTPAGKIEILS
ncbi:MAG: metallophosphoesterase [Chthoniobacter sp.]|uniref:metallophosphoesterase n=1 Tax=Chthoniobacter sp. TaxID=2510640 RepID=UPI0032A98CE8